MTVILLLWILAGLACSYFKLDDIYKKL